MRISCPCNLDDVDDACSTGFVVERNVFYAVITGEFPGKFLEFGPAAATAAGPARIR